MKIVQLYHIIFERFYQAFHRGWGGFDEDDTLFGGSLIAAVNIAILVSFQLMALYVYYSVIVNGEFVDSPLFNFAPFIFLPINLIYFLFKKRYLKILNEIRLNRTFKQRKIHTWIAISFTFFTFLLFFGSLCLMRC